MTDSDGFVEDFEEVENRMVKSKSVELKISHMKTRQLEVSTSMDYSCGIG